MNRQELRKNAGPGQVGALPGEMETTAIWSTYLRSVHFERRMSRSNSGSFAVLVVPSRRWDMLGHFVGDEDEHGYVLCKGQDMGLQRDH